MFEFLNNKKAFGLEISDFSLKALWLKRSGDYFNIISYNRLRLPKGLLVEGEIKDENKLASLIRELLDSAKPQRITNPYVVSSLPENKVFTRMIKVPLMKKEDLEEAVRWEAENHIPVSVEDVYLDWQILSQKGKDIELLLSAAPKELVNGYVNTFRNAKLNLQALEPCAASKARALIPKQEKNKIYLIVDIGAMKTVLDLVSNNKVYFSSSSFKISGNIFTNSIAKCLDIKSSEAEKEKISCCSPKMSERERKILESIHPVLDELASEITKVENYYYSNFDNGGVDFQIFLCGGGASFFGIVPYLSLKTKKKIKLGNPWINIKLIKETPLNHADSLTFTEVIGLAIRGSNLKAYTKK